MKVIFKTICFLTKKSSFDQEDTEENYDELRQTGSVSFKLLIDFMRSGYGVFGIILTLGLFISAQTAAIFADYWLISWSSREQKYWENALNTVKTSPTSNSSTFSQQFERDRNHNLLIYSSKTNPAKNKITF